MIEEGYHSDNPDDSLAAAVEPKPPSEDFLQRARAYNEAAADTHDARVDLTKDPSFDAFRELMEASKNEFRQRDIPPELDLYVDKMLFDSRIKKLGELRGEEPDRAVGTAVMAMTDFLGAHPDQSLAELGLTSAKSVAKATEKNGVIPAPALGFVYEMFRLKAASQAAPAVAESGVGK